MAGTRLRRDDEAYDELWELVEAGKLAAVKKKVAAGVDPCVVDEDGASLLAWIPADEKKGVPMLAYLLDQGVPPDAPRRKGQPKLLAWARELGLAKVVGLLEARGAGGKGAAPAKAKAKAKAEPGPKPSAPAGGPASIEPAWTGTAVAAGKSPHPSGLPDWKKVYGARSFPGCAHPPIHLLTLDLAAFAGLPPAVAGLGKVPIVHAACAECDPEDFVDLELGKDGKLRPLAAAEPGSCEESSYEPSSTASAIAFTKGATPGAAVQALGKPRFVQARDDWPGCGGCGSEKMFFLAQLWRFKIPQGAEGPGYHLYVFVCGPCRRVTVVKQMT